MTEVSTIGLDLAKNVFQAHGADAAGVPVFRKKLRRDQVLAFFASQPSPSPLVSSPWKPVPARISGAERWASSVTR